MFDIAFSEMLIIAVIALVVIGPEKLPKVAKTIGHLLGKAQRYVSDVKSEINREMEIDELRKLQAEMQAAATKVEGDVQTTLRDAEFDMNKSVKAIEDDIAELEGNNPPVAPAAGASVGPEKKPAQLTEQPVGQTTGQTAEQSTEQQAPSGSAPKAEAK